MRLVNLKCFLGQEIAVPRFVQKAFYHLDWKLGTVFWACLHSAFMGVLCCRLHWLHWLCLCVWCLPQELSSSISKHEGTGNSCSLHACGNVDGALDTSQQSLDLPAPHCWHTMVLVSLLQCWCSMHLMSLLLELFECMFCYNFLNVSALLSVTLQESCKHPQPLPS